MSGSTKKLIGEDEDVAQWYSDCLPCTRLAVRYGGGVIMKWMGGLRPGRIQGVGRTQGRRKQIPS